MMSLAGLGNCPVMDMSMVFEPCLPILSLGETGQHLSNTDECKTKKNRGKKGIERERGEAREREKERDRVGRTKEREKITFPV